jgi:uncharacterized membrane protein
MLSRSVRHMGALAMFASLWSLGFAVVSARDYASHLDRGLHDLHCSWIPGMGVDGDGGGCRVALNSPYAAVLKDRLWGGIPISLFGIGCFAFLAGFSAYVYFRGARTSQRTLFVFACLGVSPMLVSLLMFAISWFKLGAICKTCAGIYVGSTLLAVAVVNAYRAGSSLGPLFEALRRPGLLSLSLVPPALLVATLTPALVYAALVPDQAKLVLGCGALAVPDEAHQSLLKLKGAAPQKKALFFEDPLCPSCRALHQRLSVAGVLPRLDAELALFPLDSECNWMLTQSMHPGACQVSKALLCSSEPAVLLEWAYENQEALSAAGKSGEKALSSLIHQRWGTSLDRCMSDRSTLQKLNRHLHFAVENKIAVSTPQVFVEGKRLCDEDIDIGLLFALSHLAPEVLP